MCLEELLATEAPGRTFSTVTKSHYIETQVLVAFILVDSMCRGSQSGHDLLAKLRARIPLPTTPCAQCPGRHLKTNARWE